MENLWKERKPPTPLDLSRLPVSGEVGWRCVVVIDILSSSYQLNVNKSGVICSALWTICLVGGTSSDGQSVMRDQRVWSVVECAEIFCRSITELKQQLTKTTVTGDSTGADENCSGPPAMLVWDKVRHWHTDVGGWSGLRWLIDTLVLGGWSVLRWLIDTLVLGGWSVFCTLTKSLVGCWMLQLTDV